MVKLIKCFIISMILLLLILLLLKTVSPFSDIPIKPALLNKFGIITAANPGNHICGCSKLIQQILKKLYPNYSVSLDYGKNKYTNQLILIDNYHGSFKYENKYKNCIRIYMSTEPKLTKRPECDIFIGLMNEKFSDISIPLGSASWGHRKNHIPEYLLQRNRGPNYRNKFMCFLYSNYRKSSYTGVVARLKFLNIMNKYKKVDDFYNKKSKLPPHGRAYKDGTQTYLDDAVGIYEQYKFVIAGENIFNVNDSDESYLSEKFINVDIIINKVIKNIYILNNICFL